MVKLSLTLIVLTTLTLPQTVCAESSIPPKALAQIEARVDFCVRVDAASADQYKALGKAIVADMSEKELKEARESSDYKPAYDGLTGQLEKIPHDKAVEGCRAGLSDATK
jgi:hypothetical protein